MFLPYLPCFFLTHIDKGAFCGRFFKGPRGTWEPGAFKKICHRTPLSMCVFELIERFIKVRNLL